MLRLKLIDLLFDSEFRCTTQPAHCPEFVEETRNALRMNNLTIPCEIQCTRGNDACVWKDVIGQHGDANINDNEKLVL